MDPRTVSPVQQAQQEQQQEQQYQHTKRAQLIQTQQSCSPISRTDKVLPSVLDAIGKTPLVDLSRLTQHVDGRILLKLEYLNPGYSKKDRIALQMMQDAKREGKIQPGITTIVELTSGNTGTGLAIVCGIEGYDFIAVMSKGNSMERARMMSALGATVVLVDQLPTSVPGQVSGGDLQLVEEATQRILRERAPNVFRADQFSLESNARAHYLHTGPEILRQIHASNQSVASPSLSISDAVCASTSESTTPVSITKIDVFCDFVGTGGSFAGCAAAFKEYDPTTECWIIEPENSAVLAAAKDSSTATISHEGPQSPIESESDSINSTVQQQQQHRIQGGGYSMSNLPQLNTSLTSSIGRNYNHLIDGYTTVTDDDAIAMTRRLAKEEGIFAGFSTGANVAVAFRMLQEEERYQGKTFVVLACDSGLKYLSTDLWA